MRVESFYRKWAPKVVDKVGPAASVCASAVGSTLEYAGLVEPGGLKLLPPNLLKCLPPVEIDRPVVIVPGYNTSQNRFTPLVEHLAQPGHNGGRPYYLKGGQVFLNSACTQAIPAIPSNAKVFVAFTQQGHDAPPVAAPQLAGALEQIRTSTGNEKVDVTAYSMGGLTTRYYLQEGGDAVGKLLMVGTPNQGAQMAEGALEVLDLDRKGWPVDWIMSRKPLQQDHREALTWLLPPGSDYAQAPLAELNRNWPEQQARVEKVGVVGSGELRTCDTQYWFVGGDGQVTADSLELPGMQATLLEGTPYPRHRYLFSNPQLQAECKEFFGWR